MAADAPTTSLKSQKHDGRAATEAAAHAVFEFNLFGNHIVLTRQQLLIAAAVVFVLFVWRVWWRHER